MSVANESLGEGLPAGSFLVEPAPGVRDEVESLEDLLGNLAESGEGEVVELVVRDDELAELE